MTPLDRVKRRLSQMTLLDRVKRRWRKWFPARPMASPHSDRSATARPNLRRNQTVRRSIEMALEVTIELARSSRSSIDVFQLR